MKPALSSTAFAGVIGIIDEPPQDLLGPDDAYVYRA
jgi:hypothetical protein